MNASVTSSPTDFFKLVEAILGDRKHIRELVVYYQKYPEKVKLWLTELDRAISLFNISSTFPDYCLNAVYLKKVLKKPLPATKGVFLADQFFRLTLKAMNKFEFFDDEWEIDKLARACVVAFYRTFMLNSQPYLKEKNTQVASAIEEMLALMAMSGNKTELFEAIKFWIEDWRGEGFSQDLAKKIKYV